MRSDKGNNKDRNKMDLKKIEKTLNIGSLKNSDKTNNL